MPRLPGRLGFAARFAADRGLPPGAVRKFVWTSNRTRHPKSGYDIVNSVSRAPTISPASRRTSQKRQRTKFRRQIRSSTTPGTLCLSQTPFSSPRVARIVGEITTKRHREARGKPRRRSSMQFVLATSVSIRPTDETTLSFCHQIAVQAARRS